MSQGRTIGGVSSSGRKREDIADSNENKNTNTNTYTYTNINTNTNTIMVETHFPKPIGGVS